MNNKNPNLPEGQWSVTKEEKKVIIDFGRKLTKFVFDYANDNKSNGRFHLKVVAGGFQYFMDLQKQKATVISDDLIIVQDAMSKHNISPELSEPFVEIEIPEETKEQKIARLKAELAQVETVEVTEDKTVDPALEAGHAVEAEVTETAEVVEAPEVSDADVEDASVAPSTN